MNYLLFKRYEHDFIAFISNFSGEKSKLPDHTMQTFRANARSWPKRRKFKNYWKLFFFRFPNAHNINNECYIQITLRSMAHLLRCILNGKRFTLSSSAWTTESKKRLIVLLSTTIGLLFARFKVMGSQLPVFTRYVWGNGENLPKTHCVCKSWLLEQCAHRMHLCHWALNWIRRSAS